MYDSIVEEMALIGKSLDINTALRAACGAAKMLALSEGVVCPYTIDITQFTGKCGLTKDVNAPKESVREQLNRAFVFIRALQQGIPPPTNIAKLPAEEVDELLESIFNLAIEFKTKMNKDIAKDYLDWYDFLSKYFFRIDPSQIEYMKEAYNRFINADNATYLLEAYDCKKQNDIQEDQFLRFIGYIYKGRRYFNQIIENIEAGDPAKLFELSKQKGYDSNLPIEVSVANKLEKINILIEAAEIIKETIIDRIAGEVWAKTLKSDREEVHYSNVYYIFIVKTDEIPKINPSLTDLSNQTVLIDIFDKNVVTDVHPYLMYLLQTDPWASNTFMARSFSGNMALPDSYSNRLAYYIVAHSVANTNPKYKGNPGLFYSMTFDEKKPEMLAALKANKAELTKRIADGYDWLGEPNPGIGKLLTSFGGSFLNVSGHRIGSVAGKVAAGFKGIFTRSKATKPGTGQGQAGGKRVTRKVRILPVNG